MMLRVLIMLWAMLPAALPAQAQQDEIFFYRIGTGGVAGTYYPIGGLISDIISNPPGGRPCDKGGSCGVAGMVAIAQTSNGSLANVEAILSGGVDSGFVQSDIAYWAYTGTGTFEDREPADKLRAIANLYQESIHLVTRPSAEIVSVRDLAGKKVSLDEAGSGTLVDARIILAAHELSEEDIEPIYVGSALAISMMRKAELDAFFLVAGYPAPSIADLAADPGVRLVPIQGAEAAGLVEMLPFFSFDLIPFATYVDNPAIETLSVGALWLVSADADEELIYNITRALWHPNARQLLDHGHPKGSEITLESALDGISVPLHPGAERYYQEAGVLR